MADGDGKVAVGLVTHKFVTLKAQGDKVVRVHKWNFAMAMAVGEIVIRATKESQAAAAGEKATDGNDWLQRIIGEGGAQAFDILRLSVDAEHRQLVDVTMDAEDAFNLFDALSELNRNSGALVKKVSGLPVQFLGLLGENKS